MAASSADQESGSGWFSRGRCWFKGLWEKLTSPVNEFASNASKIAKDDPRRIIHSLKVALAITLVSLFYYFDPLYEGFGVSAMWAVMTVVVVFEFSVGATLGRGVNRGIATLVAGGLGVGAHRLASLSGETLEPLFLGLSVFLIAGMVTFLRFFPKLKARYDYGLMIFILTFCLISVSGYRDDEVLDMAHKRLSTVLIGGCTALGICILICPVWAGEDLHNRVSNNIDKLGTFLQGFGGEYFRTAAADEAKDGANSTKALLEGYRSVLTSKTTEETLANFARWEPRYGRFRYRHPWDQYLKIGAHVQECAYRIDALNGCLHSELKASPEIRAKLEQPCKKVSSDCSKALKELALTIKTMTTTPSADIYIANAKSAAKSLKSMLKLGSSWQEGENLLEIVPAATMVSLLLDVLTCTLKIAESVNELASRAKFNKIQAGASSSSDMAMARQKSLQRKESKSCIEEGHIVINVE